MNKNKHDKPHTVKQLLVEARRMQNRAPYISSDQLGAVIEMLHVEKGLSLREVTAWFETRGMHWSVGGMTAGWKRWKAQQHPSQKRKAKAG